MLNRILHNPQAAIVLLIIVIVLIVAVFSPVLAPHDPNQTNIANLYAQPDSEYMLGTDEMGRCILSRLMYEARESMALAVPSLFILTFISTICAYFGGAFDKAFNVVSNIFMAFSAV